MSSSRINIMIPDKLLQETQDLVDKGYFNNFSELVRESLRMELMKYRESFNEMTEDDKALMALAKKAHAKGNLLGEKEAKKHGLEL